VQAKPIWQRRVTFLVSTAEGQSKRRRRRRRRRRRKRTEACSGVAWEAKMYLDANTP